MEPVAEGATKFQHTAARRRLPLLIQALILPRLFQHTAARRRLPAIHSSGCFLRKFQHTAARRRLPTGVEHAHHIAGFNTQPRGGGCCPLLLLYRADILFQHTAARRRLLASLSSPNLSPQIVSTHSRAEAAAHSIKTNNHITHCFNTQPRGGGCTYPLIVGLKLIRFQHTAARRRLPLLASISTN